MFYRHYGIRFQVFTCPNPSASINSKNMVWFECLYYIQIHLTSYPFSYCSLARKFVFSTFCLFDDVELSCICVRTTVLEKPKSTSVLKSNIFFIITRLSLFNKPAIFSAAVFHHKQKSTLSHFSSLNKNTPRESMDVHLKYQLLLFTI